jgi:hypothetical protein
MKKTSALLALSLLAAAAIAAPAAPRYELNTDIVPAQAAPTVVKVDNRIIATHTDVNGVWVKYTLTPTTEKQYGAFGEKVVDITAVFPNP